jgi:hypothetical protein
VGQLFVGCFRRHSADLLSLLGCPEFGVKCARRRHRVFSRFSVKRPDHEQQENVRYCDTHSHDLNESLSGIYRALQQSTSAY